MDRIPSLLKSKTFWGAVVAAIGYLLGQDTIGITEIITAGGVVVGAAGVKDNFTKIQQGKVDPPQGANSGDYEKDRI